MRVRESPADARTGPLLWGCERLRALFRRCAGVSACCCGGGGGAGGMGGAGGEEYARTGGRWRWCGRGCRLVSPLWIALQSGWGASVAQSLHAANNFPLSVQGLRIISGGPPGSCAAV